MARSDRTANLVGRRFGLLVVVSQAPNRNGARRWWCKCDCGGTNNACTGMLVQGRTTTCGCRRTNKKTHGASTSRLYKCWQFMISRCTKPKNRDYKHYGARGIRVSDEWRKFENFYRDMGDKPTPAHSLDRIDNNGNYEKGNCRWATLAEQARNRRSTVMLEFGGRMLCIKDWSAETGISAQTISNRMKEGLPIDQILSTTRTKKTKRARPNLPETLSNE